MSLIDEIGAAWQAGRPLDGLLSRFVIETNSRASGVWRLVDNHLLLMGFGWADDMSADVSQGFQEFTRKVSLDQIGLGIVRAALTDGPALARRDASVTGLSGSASWIEKFCANTSLALPIHDIESGRVLGVAAVSTEAFVEVGDPLWRTLHQLSRRLGGSHESCG